MYRVSFLWLILEAIQQFLHCHVTTDIMIVIKVFVRKHPLCKHYPCSLFIEWLNVKVILKAQPGKDINLREKQRSLTPELFLVAQPKPETQIWSFLRYQFNIIHACLIIIVSYASENVDLKKKKLCHQN